jgi:hypothetical protein
MNHKMLNSTQVLNLMKSITLDAAASCNFTIQHAAPLVNVARTGQPQLRQVVARGSRPFIQHDPLSWPLNVLNVETASTSPLHRLG